LRLSGVYLALATFALATAMPQLLKLGYFEHWTGGVQGLVVTKPDAPEIVQSMLAWMHLKMSQDMWLYYFTLLITIAIYIFSVNLLRSRSGRAFMAIRDNEIAASAMGINVALYKTLAFGVSAGITGIAGGLGAIAVQFVAPDGYTITLAISLFLGMVVGGVGWLPGSIVGSAFIIFVPNIAEGISKGLSGAVVRRHPVSRHLPGAARRKAGSPWSPSICWPPQKDAKIVRGENDVCKTEAMDRRGGRKRSRARLERQRSGAEEVRHRRNRHRNQDRQHHAL